jgi:large subunit ribosomal protein L14
MRSILDIADNTGARRASMIGKIGHPSRYAHVGDIITIHIKESSTDATVKKGEVVKAVIVRTKRPVRRADGSYLRFDSNAVVIIDEDEQPEGHPHLRPGRPRTPRQELHEDHLPSSGGSLTCPRNSISRKTMSWSSSPAPTRASPARCSRSARPRIAPVVEGVAMIKRHLKKSQENPQGKIAEREGSIHVSNLMLQSRFDASKRKKTAASAAKA